MANVDKGRKKWRGHSRDDTQDMRVKEEMKGIRRGKPQVEIYRPGSGPLRKSAVGEDEMFVSDNVRRYKNSDIPSNNTSEEYRSSNRKPHHSSQDHLHRTKHDTPFSKPDDNHIAPASNSRDEINSLTRDSQSDIKSSLTDLRKKSRKPEQALYVPKPLAQAIAERDVHNDTDYKDSRSANFIREKDAKNEYGLQGRKEENWDEPVKDVHSRYNGLERSETQHRNGSSTTGIGRSESFKKPKHEGSRKGRRETSSKEWTDRESGNSTLKQSNIKHNENRRHHSGNRKTGRHVNDSEMRSSNDGWSDEASTSNQRHNVPGMSREIRQASEPRALPPTSLPLDMNRTRDTRSVEPQGTCNMRPWNGNRLQLKPPSGRRDSMKDGSLPPCSVKSNPKLHHCYDSLPPRLKKKFLAENMGAAPSYIGSTSEGVWDGSTVTFQGSCSHQMQSMPHYTPSHHSLISSPPIVNSQHPDNWAHTLPSARARGRGRLRSEEAELELLVSRFARSLTPDGLSLPMPAATNTVTDHPSRTPSQETVAWVGERRGSNFNMKTSSASPSPMEERQAAPTKSFARTQSTDESTAREPQQDTRQNSAKQPCEETSPKQKEQPFCKSPSPQILDWGEEVERTERLEAEAMLSDVMTRSSSLASLQEKGQMNPPREKRRNRKKKRRGGGGGGGGGGEGGNVAAGGGIGVTSDDGGNVSNNTTASGANRNRNLSKDRRKQSRDRNQRRQSKERNRGLSCDRNARGDGSMEFHKSRSNRSKSRDHITRSDSRGRYAGSTAYPENERNNRVHSRDRRGNSQDRSYMGHSKDNYRRGRNQDQGHGERDRPKENWREEQRRTQRQSSAITRREESKEKDLLPLQKENKGQKSGGQVAGILVIPSHAEHSSSQRGPSPSEDHLDFPRFCSSFVPNSPSPSQQQPPQRQLFDPSNPSKPIIVSSPGSRAAQSLHIREGEPAALVPQVGFVAGLPPELGFPFASLPQCAADGSGLGTYITDQWGNSKPTWYDPYSSNFRSARNPHLLFDIERADMELQWLLNSDGVIRDWERVMYLRHFLQQCLHNLLMDDIKFCQAENVEQHLWKILFYNIIELLRKGVAEDAERKEEYKMKMISIIEEGTAYFEKLLDILELTYKFKLESYLSPHNVPTKRLGFVGLALISAQKIFLFIGDLARYKEQVNETSNFGKSRQCYIKAHQINPKNGRPYNQLALLAVYARRKLDAVYYYMRSLMASNPFQSARESLLSIFDESRKKYEQSEKKRREEREGRHHEKLKEKEGEIKGVGGGGLRREYWVHPEKGRPRLHITTSTVQDQRKNVDSEEEELAALDLAMINKRFVTSYLHVQGKLFTKVGMESFQEAALQMLREFRTLLQHSPIPLSANRLLQLLALNMFAIENTQLKEAAHLEPGYRSAVQESALIVSLQMFNLILERCVSLLREQLNGPDAHHSSLIVSEDMQVLLPAVKVWCDWLLCHKAIWNPPPSCTDYRVGPTEDSWSRVATLVNLLEKLEHQKTVLVTGPKEGYELVRLPEDATLSGFTPLMYNDQETIYTSKETDMELAQLVLRIRKVVFFGTVFLCGIDPPVLKLQKFESGFSEYVSVVQSSSQGSPSLATDEGQSDSELIVESFSEDEGEDEDKKTTFSHGATPSEIQSLLHRKEELERSHRKMERHKQRVQAILRESVVSVEIEVKPHYLVPDTNCFIDYLSQLQTISQAGSAPDHYYTLTVPLVVVKELEGLARGGKDRDHIPVPNVDPEHALKVAEAAKQALAFLRSRTPGVKCVTTKGTFLATSAFTMEEDTEEDERNDDRILATCLSLCRTPDRDEGKPGEPRRLYREVVLLTEDRNLRVKALARHMPVRGVPDFMQWAGLG